jgi:hypothetical protein
MKIIDLDSHSRLRPQDYVVASEYTHLKLGRTWMSREPATPFQWKSCDDEHEG